MEGRLRPTGIHLVAGWWRWLFAVATFQPRVNFFGVPNQRTHALGENTIFLKHAQLSFIKTDAEFTKTLEAIASLEIDAHMRSTIRLNSANRHAQLFELEPTP